MAKNTEDNFAEGGGIDFDVSFILSKDELCALVHMSGKPADGCRLFIEKELGKAAKSDLSGLVEKKMAYMQGKKMLITPVIKMLSATICMAERVEIINSGGKPAYIFTSPFIKVRCERYSKSDNHIRLIPLQKKPN